MVVISGIRAVRRAITRFVRFIGMLYVSLTVFAWGCSDSMIFHPPKGTYRDGPDIIKIDVGIGQRISAMYLVNPLAKFTLLISHGNAEDIGTGLDMYRVFAERGYNVLVYDYRGYGTSDGRPSEKNTYEDVTAAYDFLVGELKVPPERIIALGRSVGSGPAVYLASRKSLAGLILESPFVSAFRVMTRVPILPFDKFNNLSRIGDVHCPVLIAHGMADEVVGLWHGKKLFDRANEPKLSLWVEGAGHNNLLWEAGESYWKSLGRLTGA